MPGPNDYMKSFQADDESSAGPGYMKSFQPDTSADPEVVAHAAADTTPVQAARTLDISEKTGAAPQFVQDNFVEASAADDKQRFTDMLRGRPVMSAWAAQSPQHAAALKSDAEALGKQEGWFSGIGDALHAGALDLAYAESMREYMGSGGRFAEKALDLEDTLKEYDSKPHGYAQTIARAVPQMMLYGSASVLTGSAGVAALIYAQNKGVLARQIQLASPGPSEDGEDTSLTREEVDKYATVGSAAAAVTLAGLLGPLLRSLPGVKEGLQSIGATVLARGAATTLGQAALRSLLSYGSHTAMGALGMTLQHVINSATTQKAAGQDVDWMQLGREGVDTFVKVLPVAATFAAYGPAQELLAERGRLNAAPLERARLDAQVELAKQTQLTKTAPQRAAELFGLMGHGAKVFIDWKAAQKMKGIPPTDLAAAEAAQGDVEVPLNEYLAHMADQHEAVKDDVKLSPNGYSMNEARARDKELRGVMPEDLAHGLLGKQSPDDILGFEQPAPEETAAPPAAPKARPAPGTLKLQASFQNKETGEVINTGPFHDLSQLPGGTNAHASGKFTDGFTDQNGNFYTRDEAAKAMNVKGQELASGGLATEDLRRMEKERLAEFAVEMAKQYGGSAEKWQAHLTPELMEALKEEGSKGAVAPEEHAARVVEAMQVGEIDPARFERLAKKSDKYIQEAAEKARTGSVAGAQKYAPADVAILQTHELARDVNRAKAAKAAEVKAELDKSFANLSKQAGDQKLRALLNMAGAPLLNLFDALTGGVGASKSSPIDLDRAGALPEVREWLKESARPALPDERFVEKFLANSRPWDQLKPAEARTIADTARVLTKAAREENIVRRKDAEATVAEAAEEIRGELRQNPDKGLPLPSGVPSTWWRDRLLDANAANAVQLRPKNNMRQKSPALQKWVFDRINDAVYARDGLFRDVGGQWKAAFEAMPEAIAKRRFETHDLSDKLPVQGMEPLTAVPRQYLWKLARHRMSRGNMERVASTSGWDRDVIDNILFDDPKTKLTVPEWDYLQSLADVNEKSIWPKVKEHYEKFYGQAPPKTAGVPFRVKLEDGTWKDYAGGYEPLKRDARPGVAPQAEPTKGIAQYWDRNFQTPWTPGSMKERVDNSHYLVNMDWDSSRATAASVLHWLAFDQPVRDVAKLLNDQGLAADMNRYMGEARADSVRGWLKSSATRQAQSVPEGMEVVGKVFGFQRRLQLMQIVGGSARLAAAQLSHPFGLMLGGQINPIHGFAAFFSTFKPLTMADGEVRLFPNWNDAILHGEEVQHRADNAYGTLRRNWDLAGDRNPGPIGALKELALRTAGLYLHAVDRLTTTWAWTAAHNEAVAKGMEPFSREAKDYANGKAQDVMPVHDIETAAPILTNRQMGGFLIMHGFKNTLYNMRQDALAKSMRDFNLAESPGQYGSALARAAGRVALQTAMFGGFAVMGKFALGYGQQADESKGAWFARDFLGGQGVDIPLIGGLGEPLAKWMTGGHVTKRDFSLYGNPGVAAIVKLSETLGNLVNGGREDYKKVFDVLEAALFFRGVPSRTTRIGAEHIYELVTGEGFDNADQSDDAGRFFYTQAQWDSIKRTLTPDE
jgi:hypothetical protein